MTIRVKKKRLRKLLLALDALLVLLLCASLFLLVRTLVQYAKNKRLYSEAQQIALSAPSPSPSAAPAGTAGAVPQSEAGAYAPASANRQSLLARFP